MEKTFEAFFDDLHIIQVSLGLNYYNGVSQKFTVIDANNQYFETIIRSETISKNRRIYELYIEGLVIGDNYSIVDEHFLKIPVVYRYVVRTDAFDQMFYYHHDDLGYTYSKSETTFKLWAPTASRVLIDIEGETYPMKREDKGVYVCTIKGDLDNKAYQYLLNISSQWHEATDPYALSSTANHQRSVVIDLNTIQIDNNKAKLAPMLQKTDAIIYELHVRDFSADEHSGIKNKGHFLGLIEEGTKGHQGHMTGLDYLISLGFTHLQLLPIYDFGSVDELNPKEHYNWGYDPVQYNIPEGSYATNIADPYSRVKELKQTIAKLHAKGLRVIMDVVYNHMFDRFTSNFENIVPYYYFRIDLDGTLSNGSFCGNDFDSTRMMARKYILDSIKHWMTEYGVDGFRFDLMGILDVETMNQVADLVEKLDASAMVYGEGWNMPTLLDDAQKATMMNQAKMNKIGFFNDMFRDTIKGGSMEHQIFTKGIALGNLKKLSDLKNLLKGSQFDRKKNIFFSEPWKSINYVECHDNQTVFDKMLDCEIPEEELIIRQKLMLAITLFSQGIPFIHAGQEFCRTKNGHHNSYMSSDDVNKIDWARKETYKDVVEYFKDAVIIRKTLPQFREMVYNDAIKVKVKKIKKIVEVQYDKTLKMIINFGQEEMIELKRETIVFNKEGLCQINTTYTLNPLELIIIQKAQ